MTNIQKKVTIISTYPPRQCGIGTFSQSLIEGITGQDATYENTLFDVIAINDPQVTTEYPPIVKLIIDQQNQRDYLKAAAFINLSGSRSCLLQHEYGIFGGQSGIYILPLLHELKLPLIVTLHTVLKNPSFIEKSILQEIGKVASRVVVMSESGVQFLTSVYQIDKNKIIVIPHGIPKFNPKEHQQLKRKFHYENKKVLMTFGLLGRNKGIETVIHSLPEVVKRHPEVVYLVLGNTHPNVLQQTGESYRHYLKLLVRGYHLEDHVFFIKQFLPKKTLLEYLTATDIYITPYINEAQVTSGTLSYGLGAGAACVSTPFWHARELLGQQRGMLFDFKDSNGLSTLLINLLQDRKKLNLLKRNAYNFGKKMTWRSIGSQYSRLINEVARETHCKKPKKRIVNATLMPLFSLNHLCRLTDDTGIVQHAKYGVPNLKEGYCLDDNSRALLAVLMIYKRLKSDKALNLLPIYFSYVHYMQNVKGTFHNFLSFDRKFQDEEGSEDSFGRTIWAIGYLILHSPNDAYRQLAVEIFKKASPNFSRLTSLRGMANSIIGISLYLQFYQSDEKIINELEKLTANLLDQYHLHSVEGWHWFEDILTYDNAILPLSLLFSYNIIEQPGLSTIISESAGFLESQTFSNGVFAPIGSDGWYRKGQSKAKYPQQATDVMAMILLYDKLFEHKHRTADLEHMFTCFMWFLGENELRIPLYDHETTGCCDGLESYGVNRNQGAESSVSYIISYMKVLDALEQESTQTSIQTLPGADEKSIRSKNSVLV